jgi:hypothetical protein
VAQIGGCQAILYRMKDGFAVIAELLAKGKNGHPPCHRCPIRPRRVPQTVASDWDVEQQALMAESEAWTY